ncbi:MAG TPA: hypothetical protein VGX24_06990 [Pyrinomonadaceae bacterium]|nr:hypothetical protein [Pyrinomonadaceae bacterium]
MPTKTERIISYLPSTFRAAPRTTATYSVADAFGTELLHAENSLAALMSAHWVDHADRSAELINDLACIASLYGLVPQGAPTPADPSAGQTACTPVTTSEENVEEFREHLKRYVRTFLEGTVTVQGILRVAAEALGLRIEDAHDKLDSWWTRSPDDTLVTVESSGSDAATLLFGVVAAAVRGERARPARLKGKADLSGLVDLSGGAMLRVKVDGRDPVDIDLAARIAKPPFGLLEEITQAVNDALGQAVATTDDGRYLTLSSPTVGVSSRLEVGSVVGDAAPALLGLAPRLFRGSGESAAEVVGQVNLSAGVDLSAERYLRVLVDDERLAEVDCAGGDPQATTLDEIVAAINNALGVAVASHDGSFLKLTSPTTGFGSSIALPAAAAQDARARLFGAVEFFHAGQMARAARVNGTADLSRGVDLSQRSRLRIRIDNDPAVTVECAGANPEQTRLSEIIDILTAQFGLGVAAHDGRFITLTSPTTGLASRITFEPLPAGEDASDLIFGIEPRTLRGTGATRARLNGTPDLSAGVDLAALHNLRIAIDGGASVTVDLHDTATNNIRAVTPDEITSAINKTLGAAVASTDGLRLTLASPTIGAASSVAVEPVTRTLHRRFVTRAFTGGEAAQALFGFARREARGGAATRARVIGDADLSRGVDLRDDRFLRVQVDDWPAAEIDCGGLRSRATLLEEVIANINRGLAAVNPEHGGSVASTSPDGLSVVLVSPSSGATSRIAFEPPRSADALGILFGLQPGTTRGRDATSVKFVGAVDLSEGVTLSAADSVKLSIDDGAPLEIHFTANPAPTKLNLNEIVVAINLAFAKQVAQHDGKHVVISSSSSGQKSSLEFVAPDGADATGKIFGVETPRSYRGADAAPARVTGGKNIEGGAQLHEARFLRLAVNGAPPVDVDVSARAADASKPTPPEIVRAINEQLNLNVATHDGKHLTLTSPTSGFASSQLALLPFTGRDARAKVLGNVPDVTIGVEAAHATIEGEVDLLSPANLSERQTLKLSVDGGRPFEVNVAGFAPGATFIDEVIAHLNAAFPGLASRTQNDRLRLTSPTSGVESRLSLLPVRVLELIEYPAAEVSFPQDDEDALVVRHGDPWVLNNQGAADAELSAVLHAPHGAVGPELVNRTTGQSVRLMIILSPGERAELWRAPEAGLRAAIIDGAGMRRAVPQSKIFAGPLGPHINVPFPGEWSLSEGMDDAPATLQLNDPLSSTVVVLRAQKFGAAGNHIMVSVAEAALDEAVSVVSVEDGRQVRLKGRVQGATGKFWLSDAAESPVARLRAGAQVTLEAHADRVVAVEGQFFAPEGDEEVSLVVVERIVELFDVTLRDAGEGEPEMYSGVVVAGGADAPESLAYQINRGRFAPAQSSSRLVRAEVFEKASALLLPRGRSSWVFRDCFGARFNFNQFADADYHTRFAGGGCIDRAVFDLSHFARVPPAPDSAVFGGENQDPPLELRFRWAQHQPGAFTLNLPADLPERFGGRFDQTRFARGRSEDEAELFAGVVTEPPDDPDHIIKRVNAGSTLVTVTSEPVARVPIGFAPVAIPFRRPVKLKGGSESETARIYLAEKDVPGFIEVLASKPGAWGNSITIAARKSGPARFDVTINFLGARFENARRVVLGGDVLPSLGEEVLRPSPVGILQAKAAGVRARVTRDRTETDSSDNHH